MFLVDNSRANSDWDAVVAHVHGILERHGATIKRTQKWGERKLAYEIAGHKRCTYLVVHFEAGGDAITGIRRDAGLSDTIARTLVTIDRDGEELPDILGDVGPPGRDRDAGRSRGPRPDAKPRGEKRDAKPEGGAPKQEDAETEKQAQKPDDAEAEDSTSKEAEQAQPEKTQAEAEDSAPEEAEQEQPEKAQADDAEPPAEQQQDDTQS